MSDKPFAVLTILWSDSRRTIDPIPLGGSFTLNCDPAFVEDNARPCVIEVRYPDYD